MRQISAFRNLERDCARLSYRIMSLKMTKRWTTIFYHFLKVVHKFHNFPTLVANSVELRGYRILEKVSQRRAKCVNLVQAGINAYEAVGNRRDGLNKP